MKPFRNFKLHFHARPISAPIELERGYLSLSQQRYRSAGKHFSRALSADPSVVGIVARKCMAQGQAGLAVDAFERAFKHEYQLPQDEYMLLASAHGVLSDRGRGRFALQESLKESRYLYHGYVV